jgi:hypothetical protein
MATIDMTGTRHGAVAAAQPGPSLQVAGGIAALLEGLAIIGNLVLFLEAMLLLNAIGQYAEFHAFSSLSTTVAEQAQPYGSIAYDATNEAAEVGLGLWTLLLSWAVVSRGGLPRWLGYFGLLVGITDFLALIGPPIGEVVSIPWFIAVGIVLMRAPSVMARSEPQAAI